MKKLLSLKSVFVLEIEVKCKSSVCDDYIKSQVTAAA